MGSKSEEKKYSIDTAMQKLGKTLQIVAENRKQYYLQNVSQVTEAILTKTDNLFPELSQLMIEFADHWYGSRLKGPDAIQLSEKLEDRIDTKLFQTGKLDFEQMKKIMVRMNRIDDALMGMGRIIFYIQYYENLCREKNLPALMENAELFRTSLLNEAKETLESETKRLRNQIERCNLYYQPAIKTKALWVALASLVISSLAFLLTILKALNLL